APSKLNRLPSGIRPEAAYGVDALGSIQTPMSLTRDLQDTLIAAFQEADRRRHEYVTLEHLLYSLTTNAGGRKILSALGVDLPRLQEELEAFFLENIESLPDGVEWEPRQTPAHQRVLQRAALQAQSAGRSSLDIGNVLAAFYR